MGVLGPQWPEARRPCLPALRGANQLLNAAATLAALDALKPLLPVQMQAVRQGLMLVELPGRFQILPGRPAVVLDVAHNPQAAGVLSENLSNMGYYPETWAVFGMLADKDVAGVVQLMRGRVDHWLLASPPGPRGLPAAQLAEIVSAVSGARMCVFARAWPRPSSWRANPRQRVIEFWLSARS